MFLVLLFGQSNDAVWLKTNIFLVLILDVKNEILYWLSKNNPTMYLKSNCTMTHELMSNFEKTISINTQKRPHLYF